MNNTFTKMHGCGNDFVIVDASRSNTNLNIFLKQANRRTGIGFDQLLWIEKDHDIVNMMIYNADGSQAFNCGNGLRCVAAYVNHHWGAIYTQIRIGNQLYPFVENNGCYSVLMPSPSHLIQMGHFDLVEVGNRHLVLWQDETIQNIESLSKQYDANVHQVTMQEGGLILKPFERGVGWTQACGSGALAAYWSAHQRSKAISMVKMPGGSLHIQPDSNGGWLSGPTAFVYEGKLTITD
ncbi:MAG: diaminopimelate epimerase [Candidatus Comchoanobacterales bacterium]